jgi:8-oxo-dGTP pyrophosphatase MutT (NUDIX family)
VRVDRPAPDEELNPGDPTPARPAASVILTRDGPEELEVLLVQRNPAARFMGGAWVFPGGAVHGDEGGPAAAGVRELEEEAGVLLSADDLVPFSRWITPAEVKTRFDTYFFVAVAPPDAKPEVDGEECVDWRWVGPRAALAAFAAGDLMLVFPTIKHLERLAETESVGALLEEAREKADSIQPVQPKIVVSSGEPRVLLPGEPGFEG